MPSKCLHQLDCHQNVWSVKAIFVVFFNACDDQSVRFRFKTSSYHEQR
ncbi:unnamed protein product [Musa acuminata subsp. malaccensis]|uniref:(wild Malaysian banana) hypothetical protein n=1 Tax=Musa acuminata subsp. malaccensis TaxID=214687 RepID=A0A804IFP0_MUSAM|nr:unnamed protein product [Musa acuminata subsp. malaccensis]